MRPAPGSVSSCPAAVSGPSGSRTPSRTPVDWGIATTAGTEAVTASESRTHLSSRLRLRPSPQPLPRLDRTADASCPQPRSPSGSTHGSREPARPHSPLPPRRSRTHPCLTNSLAGAACWATSRAWFSGGSARRRPSGPTSPPILDSHIHYVASCAPSCRLRSLPMRAARGFTEVRQPTLGSTAPFPERTCARGWALRRLSRFRSCPSGPHRRRYSQLGFWRSVSHLTRSLFGINPIFPVGDYE